nr:SDR family NAD(P)-dependent oxidoreductase [Corallococcus macrosporus]
MLQGRRPGARAQAIAIVGMSGRYPQAEKLDALWEHLKAGRSCISEVPASRWDWRRFHSEDPDAPESIYSRWGGFLADADAFDAAFFNLSPREADAMDPQERQFLEVAWATFEDAGYDVTAPSLDRDVGVFVGVMNGGYGWAASEAWHSGQRTAARSPFWSVANRVSYHLNLSGPSFAVDSACSSSFTALHLACESLRRGECRAAIAGGVNLILHPMHFHALTSMKMLSRGDACRAFGEGADGFVDGEGVGAVLLKTLDQALVDGDRIHAVILGSAVNAGGKTSGYTVPNPHAQQRVISRVLAETGVHARTLSYVEAHGTGTSLGDPIEVAALQRAFREHTQERGFCALGSLKANIGHLESAAGIAALTKVVLQLREGMLVPSPHSERPNPKIDFDASPFYVQRGLTEWRRPEVEEGGRVRQVPRRAGISSFGAGGANAHVLVEEYVAPPQRDEPASGPVVLVLSAKTQERLRVHARQVAAFLVENARARGQGARHAALADIAFTSQVGRQAMEERIAVVASTEEALADALQAFASEQPASTPVFHGRVRGLSDTGAQVPAEGADAEALARAWVAGARVDWRAALHAGRSRQRVSMPTYPFVRKRHWIGEHRAPTVQRAAEPVASAPAVSPPPTVQGATEPVIAAPAAVPPSAVPIRPTPSAAEVAPASPPPPRHEVPIVNRPKIQLRRPGQTSARETPREEAPAVPAEPVRAAEPEAIAPSAAPTVNPAEAQARSEGLKQTVKGALARVLFCEPGDIDEEKNFLELGLDSILMVELTKGLSQDLQLKLKVNKLYDHPSVLRLAEYLAAQVPAAASAPAPRASELDARAATPAPRAAEAVPRESIPTSPTAAQEPHRFIAPRAAGQEAHAASHATREPGSEARGGMPSTRAPEVTVRAPAAPVRVSEPAPRASEPVARTPEAPARVPTPVADRMRSPDTHALEAEPPPFHVTLKRKPVASAPEPTPAPAVAASTDVAIIGMSARFPGARNLDEYWEHLAAGVDSVTEIPPERWDVQRYYDPDPKKKDRSTSKWGGFLSDIDKFDPLFFSISPAEARLMDPQQRLFLQESWKALEDAGYSPEQLSKARCGVYVGVMNNDYNRLVGLADPDRSPALQLLGNSNSILAARIAYLLNLKGPALALDTACSSSLVATHLAVRSLLAGDVDLMLAGGVTLYITEDPYIQMSKAGMLSPNGRCRAFDDRADGFVPGEGVGVVVLKRLADALRDGDHVYGVIRGSGTNQDGKTNGISAPSSDAQTELELQVYQRAGISPETVTYVEAHGTGTKLGDPIEVEALTEAFSRYTDRKQFCFLGSVKSNLGHTSAAAGVAGLIKVLLSFQHRQLPPSLHFERQNSNIDFAATPFVVNTALRDWTVPGNGPRRAALSGFAFSGTNAHVLLEEPPARPAAPREARGTARLVVFSGKTEDALTRRLEDMATWLRRHGESHRLGDIAYTLLVGRAHHKVRTAFVVRSHRELLDGIEAALAGREVAYPFTSDPQDAARKVDPLLKELGRTLMAELTSPDAQAGEGAQEKLSSLASLYVKAAPLNWAALFSGPHLRVPLPTYPFAQERHWVTPVMGAALPEAPRTAEARTAPVRRRTVLEASSPLMADHRVNGASVLPGMAYLELAREAFAASHGEGPVSLSQVLWLQPCVLDGGQKVLWTTLEEKGGHALFEVRSGEGEDALLHCRGRIEAAVERAGSEPFALRPFQARSTNHIDGDVLNQRFARMGIHYGPTFRALREVWSDAREALGRLEGAAPRDSRWSLPPQLLDSAAQAVAALTSSSGALMLPFSLGGVDVRRPLPSSGSAYARVRMQDPARFDVALLDEQGEVCVELRDLGFRERKTRAQGFFYLPRWAEAPLLAQDRELGRAVIVAGADSLGLEDGLAAVHARAGVLRVRVGARTRREAEGRWEWSSADEAGVEAWWNEAGQPRRIYFLAGIDARAAALEDVEALEASQERGVLALFRMLKGLSRLGVLQQRLELVVVTADVFPVTGTEQARPSGASLHGLCKSLAKEHPQLAVSCIDVGARDVLNAPGVLVSQLVAEPEHKGRLNVALREGRRHVRQLVPARLEAGDGVLRQGGVYVIVGGLGGIGLALAEDLAGRFQARLVLTGRGPLTEAQRERIAAMEARGARVLHVRADVTRPASMRDVMAQAKARFGAVHGVVHSALVLRDAPIERMDAAAFVEAMDAKVRGSAVLAQVLKDEPLDFLVFFSSIQSFSGNAGQGNYAAASLFQDTFAGWLGRSARFPVSVVNWGYWGSVGAVTDPKYQRAMELRGVHSIEVAEGLEALRQVLASSAPQVVAFKGSPEALAKLGVSQEEPVAVAGRRQAQAREVRPPEPVRAPVEARPSPRPVPVRTGPSLAEVERRIGQLTSEALSVSSDVINPEVPFSDYGVDSITGAGMIERISEAFDLELPITVVFDYSSVRALARHILSLLDAAKPQEAAVVPPAREPEPAFVPPEPPPVFAPVQQVESPRPSLPMVPPPAPQSQPVREAPASRPSSRSIAVIGMSGRFPGAPDLDTFWKRLAAGDNLVGEIPKERWDIDAYYDADPRNLDATNCRYGAVLDDIDKFDAAFFNIAGREADLSDPQQRVFLEEAWKALEDAGYAARSMSEKRCGVYVGVDVGDYGLRMAQAGIKREAQAIWGNDTSILAARIAYFLNLKGPSMAINTACSSSLVSIHLACQSLLAGETEMALAGGVYVSTMPNFHIYASNAQMLSVDGKCKSFAAGANGFVPGEGVGVVVLKPLEAALRDGDQIHGVIRASAINQDGKTNGITAPSAASQTELEASVYEAAGCDAATITFVEAHGSGTRLGDPIEVKALTDAFRRWTDKRGYCALGSVKTNVGHTIAAAGIAGVLKVLLSLRHGAIPPSLHFDTPNEFIDFKNSPFVVNTRLKPWEPAPSAPRRAAVSSFGFSGTNAHLLIEAPPEQPAPSAVHGPQLLPLSARTPEALKAAATRLADFLRRQQPARPSQGRGDSSRIREALLEAAAGILDVPASALDPERPFEEAGFDVVQLAAFADEIGRRLDVEVRPRLFIECPTLASLERHLMERQRGAGVEVLPEGNPVSLSDVAYTLQVGREAMPERLAIVARDIREAIDALTRFAQGQTAAGLFTGKVDAALPLAGLLSEGRAGTAFLQVAMEERQLSTLAQLWSMGVELPWRTLHGGERPRKVSLPTYPFARVRHWFPESRPVTQEAASLLTPRVEQALRDSTVRELPPPASREDYERFNSLMLLGFFQRMGVFLRSGEQYTVDGLRSKLRVAPGYTRLFSALLNILARAGYVRLSGADVTTLPELDAAAPHLERQSLQARGERLVAQAPMTAPHVAIMWACSERYGEVLRGEIPATDLLFPQSSMRLMGPMYKGNPVADYFNALVADSLRQYVAERLAQLPDGGKIRILEVGAGTGGTTDLALKALSPYADRIVYTYTDVSRSFVQYGRENFRYGFMEYSVLDIEKDVVPQGYTAGAYDVVLAANVLHATEELRQTLRNVKTLLRPGGWLLLNEVTTVHDFSTVAFGLLPGWWRFKDDLRLQDAPLLSSEQWRSVLSAEGFPKVVVLGHPDQHRSDLGQNIIIGERDRRSLATAARTLVAAPAVVTNGHASVGQGTPVSTPRGARPDLESVIASCVEAVVANGAVQLDPSKPFQDFGVDSIFAVSIIERINAALGIALRSTDLFNYASVSKLAEHIRATFPAAEPGARSAPAPEPVSPAAPIVVQAKPEPAPAAGDDGLLGLLDRIEAGELNLDAVERFVGGAS